MELTPAVLGSVAAKIPHIHLHIANNTQSSWSLVSPKYLFYAAALGGIYYGARKFGPLGFLRAIGSNVYNYMYGLVSLPRIAPVVDSIHTKVDSLGTTADKTLQEIAAIAKKADGINLTLKEQGDELRKQLEETNRQLEKLDEIARNCGLIPEILTIVREQKQMLADQDRIIKGLHAKPGNKLLKKKTIRHRRLYPA